VAAGAGYKPIGEYGVIGDLHTVALVGTDGSIDWCCLPHFDSPSVFAAILDARRGGFWRIAPLTEGVRHQMYLPDTNVLVTRFLHPDGVAEVVDFMPIEADTEAGEPAEFHRIVRRVTSVRGTVRLRMTCAPAFDYARARHTIRVEPRGVVFESPAALLGLVSPIPLTVEGDGVMAEFTLEAGQSLAFFLRHIEAGAEVDLLAPEESDEEAFHATVAFWRGWIDRSRYRGRWREIVSRSALVLKLLTYAPSGAIVAAPTAGLPERIGGRRNWDYRYTWIRDASFTLYALLRIGFTGEATRFMRWLDARCRELEPDGSLQVVYGIDGRHELPEIELDHLEGYQGSRPVRIGNAAYHQLQLDICGELMDAVYLYNKHVTPIGYDLWVHLRRLANWVTKHWTEKDEGIWEVRGGRQHFTYSKVMCWVALDRALRLADKRSFPADRSHWLGARDTIYEEILSRGWNPERGAFVQHYDSAALDASALIMPLVFFLSPTDPRMLSTIDAIRHALVSDSLVHRYNVERTPDGLEGAEGTFNMCTFWLVEALTRAGRVDEARLMFEKMLGYANHLGLFGEEVGPCGETLGNFPQAFTHIALISAAYNLDRVIGR
jgi:GH15 family glucan-1,4-alpha-glucosidase